MKGKKKDNIGNTKINKKILTEYLEIYDNIKPSTQARLDEFKHLWATGNDLDIFAELIFCLLTPQAKARNAEIAVLNLKRKGLLLTGPEARICVELNIVRFKNTKARNIIAAQELFTEHGKINIRSMLLKFEDMAKAREWLVENVRGMGWKEASHFMRNIGFGAEFAILDRHILKNLMALGIIDDIPKAMTKNRYIEIEGLMMLFCNQIQIPMDHMDLLLWYKETGEIFK